MNDVTSDGTDTNTNEIVLASVVSALCRLPVKIPAGIPTSVAMKSAVAPSSAVFGARSVTSCATGRRYFNDSPRSNPEK